MTDATKRACSRCGVLQHPEDFEGRNKACRTCRSVLNNIAHKLRREHNPKAEWARRALGAARARADKKGVPFGVTMSFLVSVSPDVCPVLGIELNYRAGQGRSGGADNSPSVDRHSPHLGYTEANCRVISNRANRAKSNLAPEELALIAQYAASIDFTTAHRSQAHGNLV